MMKHDETVRCLLAAIRCERSDVAVRPDRLIPLAHPAVTRLAAASAAGIGVCFGIAERTPDQRPHITQAFAPAWPP